MAAASTTMPAEAPVRERPAGGLVTSSLDEDDRPRARWERSIGWGVVAVATWLVFCALDGHHNWGIHLKLHWGFLPTGVHFSNFRFGDLFLNTTTNGGDTGAHVWWPKFLIDHWFPRGRLSGWAPDWYAGFPVGQYYFPLPSLAIWVLNWFIPYNIAFKLITVSGPLLLPAAAYYFAKGMRTPWPAPPAFALAALGMLMETRNDWQIYGGNLASTLAGEFSFTIGLALALFGLGALAYTLDTGRRRWLPALLIAAAVMSHIVVAIFIGVAATLLWLTRRPRRTWPLAGAIGVVAGAIPAVWLLPLLANQSYTQSMRYTKLVPKGGFTMWTWLDIPKWVPLHGFLKDDLTGPVHNTINGFIRALGTYYDPSTKKHLPQPLWLPWWIILLSGVAIVAAGWYRRRSTLVLLVLAGVLGVMFVQWPEHAIWNTRFLPFWLLTCGFLAAMGATELCRWGAQLAGWAYRWVRDGDLQDARARAWADLATRDDASVDPDVKKQAAWALAERRFDADPQGWEPPEHLSRAGLKRKAARVSTIALSVIVVVAAGAALNRAWLARNGGKSIAPVGWAEWNYSGYERKTAYPQYHAIIQGMSEVADKYGNGRALWEPSSGDPDAINTYGTSLALELLPYFTHGRIGSMEGIYFESSATTSYHFLTVAECSEHPSNPVRGLKYGSVTTDFDMCVRHLQMLGVRYLMLWTKTAQDKADANNQLKLVKEIPQNPPITAVSPEKELTNWKVYEVANSDLVEPMTTEPVVAKVHGGKYSQCWGSEFPDTSSSEPELGPWECTVAPWWTDRSKLHVEFTQSGPSNWTHVDGRDLGTVQPKAITPTQVTNVRRTVDSISFSASELGKPVIVKESFFPNWKVSGAKGPYRIAPNLMVVVPTSHNVKLTYGLSAADWIGRFVTIIGLAGLVLLGLWKAARRFAADDNERPSAGGGTHDDSSANGEASDSTHGDDGNGNGDGGGPPDEPPDGESHREEPAPALP